MSTWDIYFATIVGMQEHPGFNRPDSQKKTLEECAEMANEMIKVKEKICQSQQQQ